MRARFHALACAAVLLVPPAALSAEPPREGTQESVRYRYGIPNAIRFDATGAQVWEYNDWRHGRQGFVVLFDGSGGVAGSRLLRTEQDVGRAVADRLTAREALDVLGEPYAITVQAEGFTWTYRQVSGSKLTVRFGADGRIRGASGTR
jgi:hypothetical protein